MAPSRRVASNGRSPLVRKQSQITTFFSPGKTPKQSPSPTPSPNPNPNPNPNPSKRKQKKTPLLIPSPSISNPKTPPTTKPKLVDAIGKRIRVFWPLDKVWYEGRVKSFDQATGRHQIQYDDAEVENIDLHKEKIEWVEEEAPSKLRRLRRVSTVEVENGSSGEDGEDSGDEDWGKGNGKGEVKVDDDDDNDDSEEVELDDEEEEEGEEEAVVKRSRSGRGKGTSSVSVGSSGKRKKVDVEKLGVSKKFRFDGDGGSCKTPVSNNGSCAVDHVVAAESK